MVVLLHWMSNVKLFNFVTPPQLYTVHVIQAGGSDKTPAIIARRYSDFRRLHATLCRDHGALMERVCFPRKYFCF